jgi:serine phosphatase RsbU (regulator of sigma subunit)
LAKIHNKPTTEQKDLINQAIDEWKGNWRQTDDITIMGIKF